ncbi:MAG: hypothetical protein JXB88_07180 [Spirochaetales bacterium]|nr:hypothetical protein [Spirochaetales bacterium]
MKKAVFLLLNVTVFFFFSVTGMYGLIGDPNNDGSIDIVDALLTAQYYVGLITEFPGATPVPTTPPTPDPLGFTPFPDVTPRQDPTSIAPFFVEMTGMLPLEMGNRDNWRNSVLSGNYLYMTSEVSFKVFDVSQPGNPVFSGFCEIPGDNPGEEHIIVIDNNYAYVSCFPSDYKNLVVLNISNPSSPSVVTSITMPPMYSMVKNGNYFYIGCTDEVFLVDITQPDNPVVIDGVELFRATGIVVYGSYAYMVNVNDDMLVVFDVSNRGNPVQVDTIPINLRIDAIVLSGHYAFLMGNTSGSFRFPFPG